MVNIGNIVVNIGNIVVNIGNVVVNIGNVVQQSIHKILEHTKYSNFNKLLRITAYVMRYIFNLLCKNVQCKSGNLNAEELREAELLWIRVRQRELYDDNKQMKWLKKNLGIYIDE